MNMLTITINSLKNIYILLVCVYCSLLCFEINSQENITEIECNSTQYFYQSGKLSSEGCLFNGIPNCRADRSYIIGLMIVEILSIL